MPRYVLVTGGAGYIGSHCSKLLGRSGFVPVVIDDLSQGHKYAVKWGELLIGSIHDTPFLEKVIEQYKPCAVMHFAASALVQESMANPAKYYTNNVTGSISLFEAMRKKGLSKIVFSSSCATYGVVEKQPIMESAPQIPINPYGRTKLMIEQILQDYEQCYGIRHAILRYFNAAGADMDGEIGEDHTPETHIIPLILDAAMKHRPSITLFGHGLATKDGFCVRDYIHVDDLARAHLNALLKLLSEDHSLQVNLGSQESCSVMELVKMAEKITGKAIPVKIEPLRAGDPPILRSDCRRAEELLGWQPVRSSVEDIITSAWRWHQKRYDE